MDIVKLVFEMILHVVDPDSFSQLDPMLMCMVAFTVGLFIFSMFWRIIHAFTSGR